MSRRWRWAPTGPSAVLAVALCASRAFAVPASLPAPTEPLGPQAAAGQALELYLQVTLNGVPVEQLQPFVLQRGLLQADAAMLRALGLKWPGSDADAALVALNRLSGLEVLYDAQRQHVSLTAPLALLDRPLLTLDPTLADRPKVDPSARISGLLLNYDLYAQQSFGQASVSGVTEARVFGLGSGIFSNTLASRTGATLPGMPSRHVRLDSSWQRDFPDQAISLTVGDSITGAVPWSRALRMGGLRLSSNFSLQPYRVTAPLAAFQGSAVLPSTVDLFVNGLKQSSQQVQPGQFQLNSAPSLSGAGQAQMVITDINGQRRLVSFDLYGAPQLLAEGLSDWSLELGAVRQDYGLRSASYGQRPLLSASGRYGWSERSTLDAHAEVTSGLQLAGVGGSWLLGRQAGVLSASVANSQHAGSSGLQAGLGYQWLSRRFNLAFNTLRADASYRDVASLNLAPVSRLSDSAYLGMETGFGQLGVALVRQQWPGSDLARFASLSWSRQLAGQATLNINLNRSLGSDSGPTLYVGWSMPLDRNTSVSASLRQARGTDSLTLDASRSTPLDDTGYGWRVQANAGEGNSGQAQLSRHGTYGQWSAGASRFEGGAGAPGGTALFGNASGSLLVMQGQVQAHQRVDDAFALVSTSGIEGVPVRLENRLVGTTDERGLLFVTRLNAYQHNRLSIDTLGLPPDMRIARSDLDAVPAGRSGVLARFDMRSVLAVQLALSDAAGEWLPAGSRVSVEEPGPRSKAFNTARAAVFTVVGYEGLVYLEDPVPGTVLRVSLDGAACSATLPLSAYTPPAELSGLVDAGTLICQ